MFNDNGVVQSLEKKTKSNDKIKDWKDTKLRIMELIKEKHTPEQMFSTKKNHSINQSME